MKILKIWMLLIISFYGLNATALTVDQIEKIKVSYSIGKTIIADNGLTFENTLPSIMGQESSFGVYVVGDKWENGKLKSLYDSSLGNFQIKLSTAKFIINDNPKLKKKYNYLIYDGKSIYKKFEKHQDKLKYYKHLYDLGIDATVNKQLIQNKHKIKIKYYSGILNNPIWIKRYNKKTKKAIATFKWAKKELKYHKSMFNSDKNKIKKKAEKEFLHISDLYEFHRLEYNKLVAKAQKDTRLINKLLTDFKFGAILAGHYIKYLYNIAVERGYSKPWTRAVGRYNGGWSNFSYAGKISKRMKIVKQIIKKDN